MSSMVKGEKWIKWMSSGRQKYITRAVATCNSSWMESLMGSHKERIKEREKMREE